MPRTLAALAALLAVTAVGCAQANQPSEDLSGAEEDVAEVVAELQDAARRSEQTRICTTILSTALARRLGDRCSDVVQTALDDTDIFEISADSVRITGERARVRVDVGTDEERQETFELVRQTPGGWRIDRFLGPAR